MPLFSPCSILIPQKKMWNNQEGGTMQILLWGQTFTHLRRQQTTPAGSRCYTAAIQWKKLYLLHLLTAYPTHWGVEGNIFFSYFKIHWNWHFFSAIFPAEQTLQLLFLTVQVNRNKHNTNTNKTTRIKKYGRRCQVQPTSDIWWLEDMMGGC